MNDVQYTITSDPDYPDVITNRDGGWQFHRWNPESGYPPNQQQGLYESWLEDGNEPEPTEAAGL